MTRLIPRLGALAAVAVTVAGGLVLTFAGPAAAAPAVATATCTDGSRDSAATIGKDGVEEVRTVDSRTSDGKTPLATIKLRYSAAHHCVWGLISGSPGDPVWIDRQKADEATWKGPLGKRDIQRGNTTTYTGAFALPGYRARACGNGYEVVNGQRRPAPIVCTDWYSEDFVATPQPGGPSGGQPAAPSSPNQVLARRIIDLNRQGMIVFDDNASTHKDRDAADHSLARLQIADLAKGKPALYSTRCADKSGNSGASLLAYQKGSYPFRGGVPADNASATRVLQFLADLGSHQKITVNVLFGQCHGKPTSQHHLGAAVDLGCGNGLTGQAALDGLKRYTGESCSDKKAPHWHYSISGT